ncbi:UNVERIFIED_CONTAM: hypothetical protein RKD50_009014 [Streptomyces canus]
MRHSFSPIRFACDGGPTTAASAASSARRRQAETAYAVTDLRAEQATAKKIAAARARAHWAIENTVHRTKDVTFSEGAAGQVRHHSPVVVSGLRGPARATLHRDGGSASPADDVLASNPKPSPALRGIR